MTDGKKQAPPVRPNPRLDNIERRGVGGAGLLIVPIFVMGIGLILEILQATRW